MDKSANKEKFSFKDYLQKLVSTPKVQYLIEFTLMIIIYGTLSAFALSVFIDVQFNIKSILALGIILYFIREELPKLINKSLSR